MATVMMVPIHGMVFQSISTAMNLIAMVATAQTAMAVAVDAQQVKLKIATATVVQKRG
jgi:hypothetical protein